MLIEYPTTCKNVISLPNTTTLTKITTVFFTCPTTLNVSELVDLITASVSRLTQNPKNAAARYLCGRPVIFANPSSSWNV